MCSSQLCVPPRPIRMRILTRIWNHSEHEFQWSNEYRSRWFYLDLLRRVASVQGRLKIFVNTYSRSRAILASGLWPCLVQSQTSLAKCFLHNRKASKGNGASLKAKTKWRLMLLWSRFARKISSIELDCFGDLWCSSSWMLWTFARHPCLMPVK